MYLNSQKQSLKRFLKKTLKILWQRINSFHIILLFMKIVNLGIGLYFLNDPITLYNCMMNICKFVLFIYWLRKCVYCEWLVLWGYDDPGLPSAQYISTSVHHSAACCSRPNGSLRGPYHFSAAGAAVTDLVVHYLTIDTPHICGAITHMTISLHIWCNWNLNNFKLLHQHIAHFRWLHHN